MSQKSTVIEYPTGLSAIPFASFLQIEKYEYSDAQKNVAKNFNDAGGSVARSVVGDGLRSAANFTAGLYGSGNEEIADTFTYKYTTGSGRGKRTATKTIDLSVGAPNVDRNLIINVNGVDKTVGQLIDEKRARKARQSKGLMASKCMLPLPNEFQYKYGADWNNEFKLGTLALAADEAGRFAMITAAGGIIGGGMQYGADKLTQGGNVAKVGGVDPTKIVQGFVSGAKSAADPLKVNSELSPKNLAGLAGLAPNENSIQFFERMQGREFSFRFELASRNKQESNRVIEIIEWFKRGMHPSSKSGRGSAVMLTFPDVFVLTPKFVQCDEDGKVLGEPIQHPMMPRTKLCALTGLTINTTPFGQLQTVFDGSIPMVTMELMFKETTKLTRLDMEGSSMTNARPQALVPTLSRGTFTKNPDADFTGEVSF